MPAVKTGLKYASFFQLKARLEEGQLDLWVKWISDADAIPLDIWIGNAIRRTSLDCTEPNRAILKINGHDAERITKTLQAVSDGKIRVRDLVIYYSTGLETLPSLDIGRKLLVNNCPQFQAMNIARAAVIDLSHNGKLQDLPEGIQCNQLVLLATPIKRLPENLSVRGTVTLPKGTRCRLPRAFRVMNNGEDENGAAPGAGGMRPGC